MTVIVFGSINMDLVARVPRLPVPGETLTGYEFTTVPGGKGANQAVAIARLQVPTFMVGRVGQDLFGTQLLAGLRQAGVNCDGVVQDATTPSGTAIIAVDDRAENHIIIIPGANGLVGNADLERLETLLANRNPAHHPSAILLQLEIPLPTVMNAAQMAYQYGVPVILDPAPARSDLPMDIYPLISILTPNQVEASQLVGFPVEDEDSAIAATQILRERGVDQVILKLGAQGVVCATAEKTLNLPAFAVEAVDTVAAGDAFNGGLAAALAEGRSFWDAVRWGSATAALAVTKPGAQSSLPDRAAVETALAEPS
jgi:ribokinase